MIAREGLMGPKILKFQKWIISWTFGKPNQPIGRNIAWWLIDQKEACRFHEWRLMLLLGLWRPIVCSTSLLSGVSWLWVAINGITLMMGLGVASEGSSMVDKSPYKSYILFNSYHLRMVIRSSLLCEW